MTGGQILVLPIDMIDIALIPTSRVTNVVMKAIKSRPKVFGYLISGYPRNIRDVADYLERVIMFTSL